MIHRKPNCGGGNASPHGDIFSAARRIHRWGPSGAVLVIAMSAGIDIAHLRHVGAIGPVHFWVRSVIGLLMFGTWFARELSLGRLLSAVDRHLADVRHHLDTLQPKGD